MFRKSVDTFQFYAGKENRCEAAIHTMHKIFHDEERQGSCPRLGSTNVVHTRLVNRETLLHKSCEALKHVHILLQP